MVPSHSCTRILCKEDLLGFVFLVKSFFIGYNNSWQHISITKPLYKYKKKVWCEKDYKNYSITSDYNFTQQHWIRDLSWHQVPGLYWLRTQNNKLKRQEKKKCQNSKLQSQRAVHYFRMVLWRVMQQTQVMGCHRIFLPPMLNVHVATF